MVTAFALRNSRTVIFSMLLVVLFGALLMLSQPRLEDPFIVIREALITTKFGLIVAIPSLLLHAFLSRRARGIVANMERSAVSFTNRLSKTPRQRRQRVSRP